MAFPTSPTNGATTTVNGIAYTYDAANNAWTRVQTLYQDLTILGNLNVLGAETLFQVNNLSVTDSLVYLNNVIGEGEGDVVDIGFVGHFVNPGYQHTGLVRDATDGVWKLFEGVPDEPDSSVLDFTPAIYSSFKVGNLLATSDYSKSVFSNFSSANALITGGSLTGVTGEASTFTATNFSTANAQVTGGVLSADTILASVGMSTANALITGGSITGITAAISTLLATNFSSANAQVTGGAITGITDLGVADGGTGASNAGNARTNLSAYGSVNIQAFTSGTTYTPTAGALGFLVIITGGGGGGGGADAGDTGAGSGGGGGGAGATAIRTYTAAEMGATATYAIGAAGSAGAATGTNGTAGGNSSFDPAGTGTTLTANGGALGTGSGAPTVGGSFAGGIGGTASGGLVNIDGGDGDYGAGDDIGEMGIGGSGGASFWGGGGRNGAAQGATSVAGTASTTFGGGGGGAGCIDTTTGAAGGAGDQGVLVVLEFLP